MSQVQSHSHIPFIKQPLIDILKEAIYALGAVGEGIQTFPICGYVLHSVFLKLTGAQEQKLKCICWELASRDYDYRHEYSRNSLGECSSLKDKNDVYKELIGEIRKIDSTFNITSIDKPKILREWKDSVLSVFRDSIVAKSFYSQFKDLEDILKVVDDKCFLPSDTQTLANAANLSPSHTLKCNYNTSLSEIYEKYVYKERNRCAHNTRSYQNNLPYLKTIASPTYIFENYFIHISMIILLDMIFVELFTEYLERVRSSYMW